MHELSGVVHRHGSHAGEQTGIGKFDPPRSDCDRFMEAEGLPVFGVVGILSFNVEAEFHLTLLTAFWGQISQFDPKLREDGNAFKRR